MANWTCKNLSRDLMRVDLVAIDLMKIDLVRIDLVRGSWLNVHGQLYLTQERVSEGLLPFCSDTCLYHFMLLWTDGIQYDHVYYIPLN